MDDQTKEYIEKMRYFIHEAFCVDGTTEFKMITEQGKLVGNQFKIIDKKRGEFFVTISKVIK